MTTDTTTTDTNVERHSTGLNEQQANYLATLRRQVAEREQALRDARIALEQFTINAILGDKQYKGGEARVVDIRERVIFWEAEKTV